MDGKNFNINLSQSLDQTQKYEAELFYQKLNNIIDQIYNAYHIDLDTPIMDLPYHVLIKVKDLVEKIRKNS